ncbi:hypothetical protein Taro_055025 [Colocasia esculenta]|uniref:Uncharacterized protein n=1 Tax=Colocasia esculenta TaxID=4460 RepID=A0A843XPY9_COLES|nr:hypothetical protein [Colocasia esculenta]
MRGECPDLKKKLKNHTLKKIRAMLATWSDEDEEDQVENESDEEEVTCLMARHEENTELSSSFEDFTTDEWEEAYAVITRNDLPVVTIS